MVTAILTHLDNNYPLLDGDEARRSIWLVDVPLAAAHRLRNEINNGAAPPPAVLQRYEMPIVASCLRLYLLELPDSVVSSGLYEIIKTIYTSPSTASDEAVQTRITVLQNTLGQLRLANIATLDALCTHFARLIDLTSASEEYVTSLTQNLAPCILRNRTESALHFEEKYNVRFLRDLLANKNEIFNELKRSATLQHSASVARAQSTIGTHAHKSPPHVSIPTVSGTEDDAETPGGARGRAISTDESNRRAHVEERNRAIANRSRAPSPAPGVREPVENGTSHASGPQDGIHAHGNRGRHSMSLRRPDHGHRRDSSRGPETRFPVAVGGATAAAARNHRDSAGTLDSPHGVGSPRSAAVRNVRDSLEVPGSPPGGVTGMSATSGPLSTPAAMTTREDKPAPPPKDEKVLENGRGRAGTAGTDKVESPRDSGVSTTSTVQAEIEKRNSLGRSKVIGRKGTGDSIHRDRAGTGGSLQRSSLEQVRNADGTVGTNGERRGVELTDAPMDD